MSTNSDDELTKKAVESLLQDAKEWQRRRDREFRSTQLKQVTTECNKSYLKRLLTINQNHNDRIERRQNNNKRNNSGYRSRDEDAVPSRSRSSNKCRNRDESSDSDETDNLKDRHSSTNNFKDYSNKRK